MRRPLMWNLLVLCCLLSGRRRHGDGWIVVAAAARGAGAIYLTPQDDPHLTFLLCCAMICTVVALRRLKLILAPPCQRNSVPRPRPLCSRPLIQPPISPASTSYHCDSLDLCEHLVTLYLSLPSLTSRRDGVYCQARLNCLYETR